MMAIPAGIILCGSGEFLAETVLAAPKPFAPCTVVSLAKSLGPARSQGACAYALAMLASEDS